MPDTIIRQLKTGTERFEVYSQEEADEKGIAYTSWRDALAGEWALSDDGYVARVIRRNGPYYDKKGKRCRYEVVLPYCRSFTIKRPLQYLPYKKLRVWKQNVPETRHWTVREMKRARTRQSLRVYAQLLAEKGGDLSQEDWDMCGRIYRSDQLLPGASFKRILRIDQARTMVAEELVNILRDQGITHGRVIEMFSETYAKAKETGNASAMRSVAKDLSEMLDMKPEQKKIVRQIEASVNWDKLLESGSDGPTKPVGALLQIEDGSV